MGALRHSLAALAALVFAVPALVALALRPRFRVGLKERLGAHPGARVPQAPARPVWLHAASVGEAIAALPLLDALESRTDGVVASTSTPTGRALLHARRPNLACGLAPLDHPWPLARAVSALHPSALVLVETELWPCLIRAVTDHGAPVMVVSGRLSTSAFQNYARLRRWLQPTFARIAAVGARSERDAERFIMLGVARERVTVTGDLKLEAPSPAERIAPELAQRLGAAPLLVGGSTHEGEEQALLDAFDMAQSETQPLALLLAPRHPERFERVAELVRARGRTLRRRSVAGPPLASGEVLLLDSLGELAGLWSRARLAFVGGTLAPVGGHNLLEPVARGAPVLFGPHTGNVRGAVALLKEVGAGIEVEDAAALRRAVLHALAAPDAFRRRGERGRAALEAHRGASERSLALIERVCEDARRASA